MRENSEVEDGAHIDCTGIGALEGDDGLAARLDFDPVLGTKSSHDLDTIRHFGDSLAALGSALS